MTGLLDAVLDAQLAGRLLGAVVDLTEHSFEFPDDCRVTVTVSAAGT
jgi:hypothetical protein